MSRDGLDMSTGLLFRAHLPDHQPPVAPMTDRSLAGISIFKSLPSGKLADIERRCTWRQVPPREVIVRFGDESRDVYFVVSGSASVRIAAANGREVYFRDIGAGEVFGEFSAIDGLHRSATVETVTPCLVATMRNQVFVAILSTEPTVAFALLTTAVSQIRSLTERVYEYSTMAVKNRIQAELLRLARRDAINGEWGRIARLPTDTELANRISTTREAVNREINRLVEEGIARRGRLPRELTCNLQALQQLVEEGMLAS